ncbi:MAG: hypothetical protein Q8Q00_07165 [Dehalococcoidia bacterium]|nr:hypothetical protein [Dehalococcoidia bacterium]
MAVVISSDLAVGPNRFMVGLLTPQNEIVTDAQAKFRFFKLTGDQGQLRSEAQATVIKMMRGIVRDKPDGTRETVELGEAAAYAAEVNFDEAGDWGAEVTVTRGGKSLEPVGAAFTVQEKGRSVAIGEPAPNSRQLTLADVSDLSDIDTADPPDPEWHRMTIAEAVTSGKPTAIAFTTPGFCQSQMCAPMTQELAMLYEKYKDRVIFVHVEPYFLDRMRAGQCPNLGECAVPTMEEWGLQTEPWIFIVDAEGKAAAKFEAFVMTDEVEAAFQRLLGDEPSSGMEG